MLSVVCFGVQRFTAAQRVEQARDLPVLGDRQCRHVSRLIPLHAASVGARAGERKSRCPALRRFPVLEGRGAWMLPPTHRSEEHTSELQSLMRISYAVFCLKKKTKHNR